MDSHSHIWADVRDRVEALRKANASERMFGVRGHGFMLRAPMAQRDVGDLEEAVGIELPGEYRSFLTTVAAGGAGPDYGLSTPVERDGRWLWTGEGLAYPGVPTDARHAGRPFAPDEVQRRMDALDDGGVDEDDERWEELYEEQTAGAVFLSEQGCGYYTLLVLNGEHRGTLWDDSRAADCGITPMRVGFAEWYLRWLERCEREAHPA